ncbi:hypothetical protein HAL013_12910 [Helicobacter ailurogastricus]|uniref:Uncharacterized protein n=1 Tax=Helicobacter ailurogastricus TaxID=1578720 RepID=A0A0K2XE13_9HELI|nr:hypothetical protein HAL011_04360 [Helicobacter ailurogastricus]CRF43067.1 hypothetical protein HAL013_12910 [Helicobacter ailurogastricus]CRF44296.1 hypothetical protein HAL09_08720 [Helicobacter ailurogastricus]
MFTGMEKLLGLFLIALFAITVVLYFARPFLFAV